VGVKMNWTEKKCKPCERGVHPMSLDEAQKAIIDLEGWKLESNGKQISKSYVMKNFIAAVEFINRIAEVAELEDHHPDIHLYGYRNLNIELSTHAIGGLSENDFILGSKIERLQREEK